MTTLSRRIDRERRTILAMIELYCKAQHAPGLASQAASPASLCPDCQQLADYALQRIDRCPFQAQKPTCAACPIHCYAPARRTQVKQVMKFAGPRMLLRHPCLAVAHLIDGFKKPVRTYSSTRHSPDIK
jgi:hypothetical protein